MVLILNIYNCKGIDGISFYTEKNLNKLLKKKMSIPIGIR